MTAVELVRHVENAVGQNAQQPGTHCHAEHGEGDGSGISDSEGLELRVGMVSMRRLHITKYVLAQVTHYGRTQCSGADTLKTRNLRRVTFTTRRLFVLSHTYYLYISVAEQTVHYYIRILVSCRA